VTFWLGYNPYKQYEALKPEPHPCAGWTVLFNVREDCENEGTVTYNDEWYCKECFRGVKEKSK
jgi:hypothetical protein